MKKYLIFSLSILFLLPAHGAARAAVAAGEDERKNAYRAFMRELDVFSRGVIALSNKGEPVTKATKDELKAELVALQAKKEYQEHRCAEETTPAACIRVLEQLIPRLKEVPTVPAEIGGAGALVLPRPEGGASEALFSFDFEHAVASFEKRINGWKEKQPVELCVKKGLYLLLDDMLHYYAQTHPELGDKIKQKKDELTGLIDTVEVIVPVPRDVTTGETTPAKAAAGGAGSGSRVMRRSALTVASKEPVFIAEDDGKGGTKFYETPLSPLLELSRQRKARRRKAAAQRELRNRYIASHPGLAERIKREAQAQAERDCLAQELAIARDVAASAARAAAEVAEAGVAGKKPKKQWRLTERPQRESRYFFPPHELVPGYYGEAARTIIEREARAKLTAWMAQKIKAKRPAVQAHLRVDSAAAAHGGGEVVAGAGGGAGGVMRSPSDGTGTSLTTSGAGSPSLDFVSGGDVAHKRAEGPRK